MHTNQKGKAVVIKKYVRLLKNMYTVAHIDITRQLTLCCRPLYGELRYRAKTQNIVEYKNMLVNVTMIK